MSDLEDWNPFDVVEEDRDVLERIADVRQEREPFPAHLLITDPVWARGVVQRSRAERQKAAERDYEVPPPEVPARPALDHEWPRSAKTLMKKLHGWETGAWFMRGPAISGRRVLGIKSAFVLKADHPDGRRCRTIFRLKDDGKWSRESDWIYDPAAQVTWRQAESVKALEAYVAPLERPEPIPLEG